MITLEKDTTKVADASSLSPGSCEVIANALELSNEEWLALRRQGIGGSDIAAIMGESKYSSPLRIWVEKTNPDALKSEENEFTRWGKILEPIIRQEFVYDFTEKTGIEIEAAMSPFVYRSKAHAVLQANIDGVVHLGRPYTDDNGKNYEGVGCLEIKTGTVMAMGEWKDGEVPDAYYWQVQHYLLTTGLNWCLVVALIGKRLLWRFVPANRQAQSVLASHAEGFWARFVETKAAPAPSGMDCDDDVIKALFPDQVEADEPADLSDLEKEIGQRQAYKKAIKEMTSAVKATDQKIKLALGDNPQGEAGEYQIKLSKFKTSRLDSKALKQDHPEIAAKYTKQSESGRLNIK